MSSTYGFLIAAVTLSAALTGCVHPPVVPPVVIAKGGPDYLIVRLTANDDDFICAETSMFIPREKANRFCIPVREFRIIVSSKDAVP